MKHPASLSGTNMEIPHINWCGEFSDHDQEHSFRDQYWPEQIRTQGTVCAIASLLFLLAGLGPILEMGFTPMVVFLTLFRSMSALAGLAVFLHTRRKASMKDYPFLLVAFILATGIYEAVEAVLTYSPDLEFSAPFTLLIIFLFYMLFPLRLAYILPPAIISSVLYVGGLNIFVIAHWQSLIQLSLFFVAANLLGGYVLATLARNTRLQFTALNRVLELNERLIEEMLAKDEANCKLAHLAVTDPLTDIANRRHFMEQADQAMARAVRHGIRLSLIIMDIDFFKNINDSYGHAAGDTVLMELGKRIRKEIRETDTLARLGGEEFGILMQDTDTEQARGLAERLRKAITATPFVHDGTDMKITASMGIATRQPEDSFQTLYQKADNALYSAKNQGRDRINVA